MDEIFSRFDEFDEYWYLHESKIQILIWSNQI